MNVLILNGSPHTNGNTALALKELAAALEKEGIETETVTVGNRSIRGCIACNRCAQLGRCVFDDEVNRLAQQVASLSAENELLKAEAADLREQLAAKPKDVEITEVGSIAEMSFRVNGVLEATQKAADDYLAKIKEMYDAMSQDYSVYEINAQQKADAILKNANAEAYALTQNARSEVNDIWSALQTRFDNYVADKKQTSEE